MIGLNPFLDSLCNFGFKNEGLHPGGDIECFQGPQDIVYLLWKKRINEKRLKLIKKFLQFKFFKNESLSPDKIE